VLKEMAVKELVELIVKALVDNPDKVKVTQLNGEQSSIIELAVAPEDMGKVIGKQGRNAQAIRVIVSAAGMKLKKRVSLEILEKKE
jgi:predicted RNA-binding protein YlqC (UPF0109 family)